MNRDFKGIWIPKEIWLSKELTTQEKVFLAEIDSLDNKMGCHASNKYFAEFFNLSTSRVSEVISTLEKKGKVKIKLEYEGKAVKKRRIKVLDKPDRGIRNPEEGYSENTQDNNTSISNTDKESIYEKAPEELRQPIKEYVEYRKSIKAKMSDHAIELLIRKLNLLSGKNTKVAIAILEQSILNGWKGIFELKDNLQVKKEASYTSLKKGNQ